MVSVMSLTVSLGLESFASDRAGVEALLIALVRIGATTCVRHTIPAHAGLVEAGAAAIVLEAVRLGRKVVCRELPPAEARPVLKDLRAVARSRGTFAQFSWEQVEHKEIFDLALTLDGRSPPEVTERIELGPSARVRLVDLARSSRNWLAARGQVGIAKHLHAVARKHRLIVHSA